MNRDYSFPVIRGSMGTCVNCKITRSNSQAFVKSSMGDICERCIRLMYSDLQYFLEKRERVYGYE